MGILVKVKTVVQSWIGDIGFVQQYIRLYPTPRDDGFNCYTQHPCINGFI